MPQDEAKSFVPMSKRFTTFGSLGLSCGRTKNTLYFNIRLGHRNLTKEVG
jgi:hypothetical protein